MEEFSNNFEAYDLEEGEIVEENNDDDDDDEVSILEKYSRKDCFYNYFDEFPKSFTLDKLSYKRPRYGNDFVSRNNYLMDIKDHSFSNVKSTKSFRKSKYLKNNSKYQERQKSPSVTSSSSDCSCSSCSCSGSSANGTSAIPSHLKGDFKHSKSSRKSSQGNKDFKQQRIKSEIRRVSSLKKYPLKNSVHKRKETYPKQTKNLEAYPHKSEVHASKNVAVLKRKNSRSLRTSNSDLSKKKSISAAEAYNNIKKSLECISPMSKSEKITGSSSQNADSCSCDSITVPNESLKENETGKAKIVPGSLGEMLLRKQMKNKLSKKDSVVKFSKPLSYPTEDHDNQAVNEELKFEVVDLCNIEDEEDELTLRIKALQSTMKGRNSNTSPATDMLENLFTSQEDKSNNALTLKYNGKCLSSITNLINANASDDGVKNISTEISLKEKCETTTIDMDISNDSFSDITTHTEEEDKQDVTYSESNRKEESSVLSNQEKQAAKDANFPIPIEWAYMMPPPPQPNQPDNNLNSISNWCYNQNMYVQSMQDCVNDIETQPTWKSKNLDETQCTDSSYGNYYQPFQHSFQPNKNSEPIFNEHIQNDGGYNNDQNELYYQQSGKGSQASELRDTHAEQYNSFMSTVIHNSCPALINKKEKHRDLVKINLEPTLTGNLSKNLRPERKPNSSKRRGRRRRRSNRKSGNGNNVVTNVITKESENSMKNVIDDDEDILRAMLLNDLTLKNKSKEQGNDSVPELNNNNNKGTNLDNDRSCNANKKITYESSKAKIIKKSALSKKNQFNKLRYSNKEKQNIWVKEQGAPSKPPSSDIDTKDINTYSDHITLRRLPFTQFPSVKPVVINIGNDSESDEEYLDCFNEGPKKLSDQVISGIHDLIKSCRNKQDKRAQNELQKTPVIQTPKGVSHLSKERQEEYRRLRALMVTKNKALQLRNKGNQCPKSKVTSQASIKLRSIKNKQNITDCILNEYCTFENAVNKQCPTESAMNEHGIESTMNEHGIESAMNEHGIESIINKSENINEIEVSQSFSEHEQIAEEIINSCESSEDHEENSNAIKTDFSCSPVENSAEIAILNEMCVLSQDSVESKDTEPNMLSFTENENENETDETVDDNNDCKNPDFCSQTVVEIPQLLDRGLEVNVRQSINMSNSSEESGSDSDSSSTSSSSEEESDSDSLEDQMEIALRNKLLQKRQEKLLLKNSENDHASETEINSSEIVENIECKDWNSDDNSQEALKESVSSIIKMPTANTTMDKEKNEASCTVFILRSDDSVPMEIDKHHDISETEIIKDCLETSHSQNNVEGHIVELSSTQTENEILPCTTDKQVASETKTLHAEASPLHQENTMTDNNRKLPCAKEVCKNDNRINGSEAIVQKANVLVHNRCQNKLSREPNLTVKKVQLQTGKPNFPNLPTKRVITTQQNPARRIQEELKNKYLSVNTIMSRISTLLKESMSEEQICQNMITHIIKLLSEVHTLRKERKEKTSLITINFAKVTKLLQNLDEDMKSLTRLERLGYQHYSSKEIPMLSDILKNKKTDEMKRKKFILETKQLRTSLEMLESQERVLSHAFSKPLERKVPQSKFRGRSTLAGNDKKKFKLDNRVFMRPTEIVKENYAKVVAVSKSPPNQKQNLPSTERFKKPNERHLETDKCVGDLLLCPYDLLGRCNDDQCIYQHMSASGQVRSNVLISSTAEKSNLKLVISNSDNRKTIPKLIVGSHETEAKELIDDCLVDTKAKASESNNDVVMPLESVVLEEQIAPSVETVLEQTDNNIVSVAIENEGMRYIIEDSGNSCIDPESVPALRRSCRKRKGRCSSRSRKRKISRENVSMTTSECQSTDNSILTPTNPLLEHCDEQLPNLPLLEEGENDVNTLDSNTEIADSLPGDNSRESVETPKTLQSRKQKSNRCSRPRRVLRSSLRLRERKKWQ